MSSTPRHTLAAKDVATRTAVCAVCGPVDIRPNNTGWICLNKKREAAAQWRLNNPEKVKASRKQKSAHHLTELITSTPIPLGKCPVDGLVRAVAVGRGWMCLTRARELGKTPNFDARPNERCIVCGYYSRGDNPIKDGRCSYHHVGWEHAGRPHTDRPTDAEAIFTEVAGEGWEQSENTGFSWVNQRKYEERATKVATKESVVPGWRTAGQPVAKDEWKKWNDLLAAEGL